MEISRNSLILSKARKALVASFLLIICLWAFIRVTVPVLEEFLAVDKPLPHADALVLMAGSRFERLPEAARLFKIGMAREILLCNDGVSGAYSEEKQRNLLEVEWAESDLLKMGIPGKAIVTLSYSASGTIHDALHTRTAVLEKGINSIVIVTSDYHTRRALWTFERVFRDHPVTIGVHPVASRLKSLSYFSKFSLLSYELLKLIYYEYKYRDI